MGPSERIIRVKGKWVYLYRAVDSAGATIDLLLSAKHDEAAAERLPRQSVARGEPSSNFRLHAFCNVRKALDNICSEFTNIQRIVILERKDSEF